MMFSTILIYVVSFFGIFTFSLFTLTFFDTDNKKYLTAKIPKRLPTVSIVVPAWKSEKGVLRSIKNLLSLDYPKDKLEIVVVVDGNVDNTFAAASEFKKQGVKVYGIPYGGKGAALNYGIKKCSGEIIGNLDADSFLDKDALLKMVGYFENEGVMAVTPSIKATKPKTFAQKIQVLEFISSSMIKKVFSYWGAMPIATGACTLFRKEFFDKHGLYLEDSLAEDGEMSLRIAKEGYFIENAMDTAVYTDGVPTLRGLLYQRVRWFRGLIDCLILHRSLFRPSRGNIALLVLPILLTSIVLTLAGTGYIMFNFGKEAMQHAINFYNTGFDLRDLLRFQFDVFNINIGATMLLPLFLMALTTILIFLCKKNVKERQSIIQPYVYFMFIYWAIASFSWVRAAAYKAVGRKIKWGDRWL